MRRFKLKKPLVSVGTWKFPHEEYLIVYRILENTAFIGHVSNIDDTPWLTMQVDIEHIERFIRRDKLTKVRGPSILNPEKMGINGDQPSIAQYSEK